MTMPVPHKRPLTASIGGKIRKSLDRRLAIHQLIMPQLYSLNYVRQSQYGRKTILFLVNSCTLLGAAGSEHLYTIQAQKNPPAEGH